MQVGYKTSSQLSLLKAFSVRERHLALPQRRVDDGNHTTGLTEAILDSPGTLLNPRRSVLALRKAIGFVAYFTVSQEHTRVPPNLLP